MLSIPGRSLATLEQIERQLCYTALDLVGLQPFSEGRIFIDYRAGAINFVFGLPAIRNIDTLGRRKLLLGTLPFMSICMLAAALCFYIPRDKQSAYTGLIAFFLFV